MSCFGDRDGQRYCTVQEDKYILFFNTETRDYFQIYLNLGIDNNLNWPEFLPVIINSSL